MGSTLKIDFSLYEKDLPVVKSSKIFANNKNEYNDDSLYSQVIFGPVKDYECKCGKLKGSYYKGKRCDECGVLCDSKDTRMRTFAQIKLPDGVWVMFPPLKYILHKLFSKKAVDKILNFDPHIYEKNDFFIFDLQSKTLKNIYDILEEKKLSELINRRGESYDLESMDQSEIDSLKYSVIEEYMSEYLDREKYLVDYRIYSIINLKELFDYLITERPDILKAKDIENIDVAKFTFINRIPVTPPDTRPIVKIARNRFSVNDITKSYSEILKNLESRFMDDIYLQIQEKRERDIFLANASKKFQRSVDDIYKFIQDKQFGDKESLFRSSLLGKTVEFSGRTVVTCGPNVPPYMLSMPRESAKTIFLLEVLNYIVNNDNEILDIGDIASLMQLVTNKIDDAELEIPDEQFDDIYNKIRPELRLMFERPPTLFMYNDSTFVMDQLFENKFKTE